MADVKPVPEGYPQVTPYLIVDGADAAIGFYAETFGAKERMRMDGPDGRVGHAELEIGDSVIMLGDEYPEMGAKGPQSLGGAAQQPGFNSRL
jgi:PhnB protein